MPEEKRIPDETWSANEELFNCDSLGELLDENEEIIAQAELAWEDGKIVFFPSYDLQSDRENVDEFVKRGWTIITENNDDLDKVFASLTEGEER